MGTKSRGFTGYICCLIFIYAQSDARDFELTHYTYTGEVEALAVEDGVIWAGTHGGLLKLSSTGAVLAKYTAADGVGFNRINRVMVDAKGNKWVCGFGGVSRFDDTSWTYFDQVDAPESAYACAFDRQGALWAGSWQGIYRYDGTTWKFFSSESDLPKNYRGDPSNRICDIAVDSENSKWAISKTRTLLRFDDSAWTRDSLSGNRLHRFATDPEGNLLLCGANKFWTRLNGNWVETTTPISHPNYGMAYDGDSVWVAAYNLGMVKLSTTTWNGRVAAEEAGGKVTDVVIDNQGTVWCSSRHNGVWKRSGEGWIQVGREGIAYNSLHCVAVDRNNVKWFGTYNRGLSRFDGTSWTTFDTTNGLGSNQVWRLAVDRNNVLWASLGASWHADFHLGRYDGTTWTNYVLGADIPCNPANELVFDKDNVLWLVHETLGKGVTSFDGETWRTYTKEDGLVNDTVYHVVVDSLNNKWFGTSGGLAKFDGISWTRYDSLKALSGSARVGPMTVDRDNNKWFAYSDSISNGGYVEYFRKLVRYDDTAFTLYDWRYHRPQSVEALAVDSKNSLWVVSLNLDIFTKGQWEEIPALPNFYRFTGVASDTLGNMWICGGSDGAGMLSESSTAAPLKFPLQKSKGRMQNISLVQMNAGAGSSVTLLYDLPEDSFVHLAIYTANGRLVKTLVEGHRRAGTHWAEWRRIKKGGCACKNAHCFAHLRTRDGESTACRIQFP